MCSEWMGTNDSLGVKFTAQPDTRHVSVHSLTLTQTDVSVHSLTLTQPDTAHVPVHSEDVSLQVTRVHGFDLSLGMHGDTKKIPSCRSELTGKLTCGTTHGQLTQTFISMRSSWKS